MSLEFWRRWRCEKRGSHTNLEKWVSFFFLLEYPSLTLSYCTARSKNHLESEQTWCRIDSLTGFINTILFLWSLFPFSCHLVEHACSVAASRGFSNWAVKDLRSFLKSLGLFPLEVCSLLPPSLSLPCFSSWQICFLPLTVSHKSVRYIIAISPSNSSSGSKFASQPIMDGLLDGQGWKSQSFRRPWFRA